MASQSKFLRVDFIVTTSSNHAIRIYTEFWLRTAYKHRIVVNRVVVHRAKNSEPFFGQAIAGSRYGPPPDPAPTPPWTRTHPPLPNINVEIRRLLERINNAALRQ